MPNWGPSPPFLPLQPPMVVVLVASAGNEGTEGKTQGFGNLVDVQKFNTILYNDTIVTIVFRM